jgi:peroxiredoxin
MIRKNSVKFIFIISVCVWLSACVDSNDSSDSNVVPPKNDQEVGVENPIVDNKALLSWSAPFTRENGSKLELSEIGYYEINHRYESLVREYIIEYPNDEFEINDLENGEHYFKIKVVDTDGLKSEYSETVSKRI